MELTGWVYSLHSGFQTAGKKKKKKFDLVEVNSHKVYSVSLMTRNALLQISDGFHQSWLKKWLIRWTQTHRLDMK